MGRAYWSRIALVLPALSVLLPGLAPRPAAGASPSVTVDLATLSPTSSRVRRIYGSVGSGTFGLPVAGGGDTDGDLHPDYAVAAMLASPLGRSLAGQIFLAFGDRTFGASFDSAVVQPNLLTLYGDGDREMTGSEIWMDDVTGDGRADLLIARQNHTPDPARPGAGALTILVGGPELRAYAATLQPLDLRSPPGSLKLFTLVGANALDRLGIWMRTGDIDGDAILDLVIGADQEDDPGESDRGAVYVVRGGFHLDQNATIDLASFGNTAIAGNLARVLPPVGSTEFHFGATCQIADLDGNHRSEVLIGAALNRAGASIDAAGGAGAGHGVGGSTDGTLYIAWDDNFQGQPYLWTPGLSFRMDAAPGSTTIIDGGTPNRSFGEEILGGLDYDDDGSADLFVGDIVGDWSGQARSQAGSGHVFYDAASLKGLAFDLDVPPGLFITTFLGGAAGDIAGDTALHGDFDGDGIADLSFSSPHADPFGRTNAGTLHVFFGQTAKWPSTVDLLPGSLPDPSLIRVAEFYGANGNASGDTGDTLSYSAAAADIDRDGRVDLLTNEMAGNGIAAGSVDAGNFIALSGLLISNVGPTIAVGPAWLLPSLAVGLLTAGAFARRSFQRRTRP